ncbi:hypothetical protein [Chryseobacterium caseinilyticum]|uniref:Auto-transporter adhesin head GIN domain-containing protein n=1 Tax=Chryseobacterium caseinilyticum TaxID=2771428 RepID=A0ABR8ZCA3_9FLAO|nr:hypothetical protein [Chryseobacterium caseinilyticum]MBD8082483.1 hypothetical protein [Chryseobacterium caseinilyticum]
MKKLAYISTLLFFCTFCKAQKNISFEELNSQNVLQLFGSGNSTVNVTTGFKSNVVQIGNNNEVQIYDLNPKQVSISQIGNENKTVFINTSNKPSTATINSVGNKNYVDMVGSNSISEKMKINIRDNNMIIFIRNY